MHKESLSHVVSSYSVWRCQRTNAIKMHQYHVDGTADFLNLVFLLKSDFQKTNWKLCFLIQELHFSFCLSDSVSEIDCLVIDTNHWECFFLNLSRDWIASNDNNHISKSNLESQTLWLNVRKRNHTSLYSGVRRPAEQCKHTTGVRRASTYVSCEWT